jgi:ABC-type nickel/cobalt efflux system permease component RcnA
MTTGMASLENLDYIGAILSITGWALLFTLFFLSPMFGLGLIWKEKISDYERISAYVFAIFMGMWILGPCLGSIFILLFPIKNGILWWHGIAYGFAVGAGFAVIILAVAGIHRLLYNRFATNTEPDSWLLTWLRCAYCLILTTVAGLILSAFG